MMEMNPPSTPHQPRAVKPTFSLTNLVPAKRSQADTTPDASKRARVNPLAEMKRSAAFSTPAMASPSQPTITFSTPHRVCNLKSFVGDNRGKCTEDGLTGLRRDGVSHYVLMGVSDIFQVPGT
eukprot:TRINITY_DN1385_c0_g1_i1.p1 TRINITY_DN1385_c0_g1~~TRINITY_DN1385_c0_g1_i1.p1  ORF type:complete len:134 (+),score=8.55 TRINITY_DN1385_c0_g1_i1:35-403(+)